MPQIYKAILHGDKVEWENGSPAILEKEKDVPVYITVIENRGGADLPNGKKMATALQKIAANGGIAAIENASDWQREQRLNRNLTERNQ